MSLHGPTGLQQCSALALGAVSLTTKPSSRSRGLQEQQGTELKTITREKCAPSFFPASQLAQKPSELPQMGENSLGNDKETAQVCPQHPANQSSGSGFFLVLVVGFCLFCVFFFSHLTHRSQGCSFRGENLGGEEGITTFSSFLLTS